MESLLTTIADYLWRQGWQIALLVVAVGLASWALRNRSAHVRYLLWLLVLAKCLTPPIVQVPLAVLPYKVSPVTTPIISTAPSQEEVAQTPVEERLPPTPTSAAQEPLRLTTRQWLAVGWLAGVAVFTCIALTKAARTILWLRRERRMLPRTSGDSFDETFRSLRVKRPPGVWLIEGVGQPFVWGILRGDIYLPNRFAGIDDDGHRRDILAHEISHVLRFDAAVNILQIIAQGAFWFHPLVWWANQRIRREREKCCAEMAIAHLGARPKDYSSAIVSTLIQAQESTRPVPSLAVAGPVKNIEERIRAMLKPGKQFHTRPSLAVATTVVLIALVAVPTTVVLTARGQTQPMNQSADRPAQSPNKPAADNEELEQPRFAARTFNAKTPLRVSFRKTPDMDARYEVGRTPSAAPLGIPACWLWWVQPSGPVKDWDLLVSEISQNKVPGLALASATDSDLKRLADLVGLQSLDLKNSGRVTDTGVAHLAGLTRLLLLDLEGTKITDAGLEHLRGLSELQYLRLKSTPVTDAGLAYLKGLTGLSALNLQDTGITDVGLEHLKGLTRLQALDVSGTRVTDAGMVHVKGLTRLQKFTANDTRITDAGLVPLQGLTGLKAVELADTQVTDAGLEHLKGLTGLEDLVLPGQITDAGMEHLKGLTRLQALWFSGSKITDAGLAYIKGLA
jgi:beta-lactamase regulating signal transducer with metallopeptidase domain